MTTSSPGGTEGDYLEGEEGNDELNGGDGDDTWLYGGDGKDRVDGGGGDDSLQIEFEPGDPDTYAGGDGIDTVDLSYSISSQTVSLDGVANDGANCPQQCENDNVDPSVENIVGTEQRDRLTGSDANNVLQGRGGDDDLDGAGGDDIVRGDWGDDSLDGGPGNDQCHGDDHLVADTAANCESVFGIP